MLRLAEVEQEALETLRLTHEAMIWRHHQRIGFRLHIASKARMKMEVVTMRGEPEVMLQQDIYSLAVQVIWVLKQRASENLLVRWSRKDTSKLHDFD